MGGVIDTNSLIYFTLSTCIMINTFKKWWYNYNYQSVGWKNIYFAHPLHRFFWSSVIDWIIIGLISVSITFFLMTLDDPSIWISILKNSLYVLYNIVLLTFWHWQTIGMNSMKIQLVDKKFETTSFWRIFIRTIFDVFSFFLGWLPFFVSFFRKDRKTLSDLIAWTYVIYQEWKQPKFLQDIK